MRDSVPGRGSRLTRFGLLDRDRPQGRLAWSCSRQLVSRALLFEKAAVTGQRHARRGRRKAKGRRRKDQGADRGSRRARFVTRSLRVSPSRRCIRQGTMQCAEADNADLRRRSGKMDRRMSFRHKPRRRKTTIQGAPRKTDKIGTTRSDEKEKRRPRLDGSLLARDARVYVGAVDAVLEVHEEPVERLAWPEVVQLRGNGPVR